MTAVASRRAAATAAEPAAAAPPRPASAVANTTSDKLYQIISTYFTNVFVTCLHDMAVTQAAQPDAALDLRGTYGDVTQKYINLMKMQRGPAGESVYDGILRDIHAQYVRYCGAASWNEFTNILHRAFLPDAESGTAEVRKRTVARVIVTTLIKFRAWIITDSGVDLGASATEWKRIATPTMAEYWRDTCYRFLRAEIDEVCALITASRDGVPLRRGEAASASRQVVEGLQAKLMELITEKAKLIAELNRYAATCKELRTMVDKLVQEKGELQAQLGVIAVGKTAAARPAPPSQVLANYMQSAPQQYQAATPQQFQPTVASPQQYRTAQPTAAVSVDEDDFADEDALVEDKMG